MTTTFYPRNTSIGIATYGNGANGNLATLGRGNAAATTTGITDGASLFISLNYYATQPLAAFSLSGTFSFNLRGKISSSANATFAVKIYKWTKSSGLGSSLGQASSIVQLTTTESAMTATVTPTTTSFLDGDILVFEVGIVKVGKIMSSGHTVTLYYNGPTAGSSGDSYFTINPNVILQRRAYLSE